MFNTSLICFSVYLQNAPTQSLLTVVYGILEESVEKRNGEIPHVCMFINSFIKLHVYNPCNDAIGLHHKHTNHVQFH